MNRRTFLRRAAAGTGAVVVMVMGGTVWRVHGQGVFSVGQGPAYEPWTDWRTGPTEGPLALVRAGILAANPHNTQPWLFEVTNSSIDLYADASRNLGTFDPYLREMHLGLGCAIENMVIAAPAAGYSAEVTLIDGTLRPISESPDRSHAARLDLTPSSREPGALYEMIARRHTNRGPFHIDRPLSADMVAAMRDMAEEDADIRVFTYTSEGDRSAFAAMVVEMTEAIITDHEMVHDSERWFRHSWSDVQEFRDGPTLDAAGLPPLRAAIAKILPQASPEQNHQYWLDATRDIHVATAPLFGMIAIRELYDRAQNLRAGRMWQRMHLWATQQGIALQPLNQPMERVDRERDLGAEPQAAQALARLVDDPEWKPTFGFRAGYAARDASPSPRRAIEDVVI